jgi:hypothetical protein
MKVSRETSYFSISKPKNVMGGQIKEGFKYNFDVLNNCIFLNDHSIT